MAKLTFPRISNTAKGGISEVRTALVRWAEYARKSAQFAQALPGQINALFAAISVAASAVVNGQTVPMQNSAGTASGNGTVVVANDGTVTAVRPVATTALVQSTVKIIMPQATGSYVNGYTFTVANGVITGAVAS